MKLNILPARAGYTWVRSGFMLFAFKPSSFIGFFASFMLLVLLLSTIPILGNFLPMISIPAFILGMMAIGNECVKIKSQRLLPNTPPPMMMAWMTVRRSAKSLLLLGISFAICMSLVLALVSLFDGGALLRSSTEKLNLIEFAKRNQTSLLLIELLSMPVYAIFWFAPALVNYKQISIAKSLFFSAYAVFGNWRAFGIYFVVWTALFFVVSTLILTVAVLIAGATGAAFLLMSTMVMMSSMFMASTFPSFVDCFQHTETQTPQSE